MSTNVLNRYVPVEDPPEVEEPFIGLLSSGRLIGGEVRYIESDVLSAIQEAVAVSEEKYRRLEKLTREIGLNVIYDGAGWPVRLRSKA